MKVSASLSTLCICACLIMSQCESKSIFGIGTRILGDQLLLKDVQESRPTGLTGNPTINFNYAIPEPITYIEIVSEENIYADVKFSYHNELVIGTVSSLQNDYTIGPTHLAAIQMAKSTQPVSKPFEVLIMIYGFNETVLNINPTHILNRDKAYGGMLEPTIALGETIDDDDDDDDGDDGDDDGNVDAEQDEDDYRRIDLDSSIAIDTQHNDAIDTTTTDEMELPLDAIIELGHRQDGDYIIYKSYQSSQYTTQEPTNHSVTFYYIDDDYITNVKFVIFEHFADKSPEDKNYLHPLAEYSHYSPNTLKAVITDFNTTSIFVQMTIYGYAQRDLPTSYQAFLPQINQRGQIEATNKLSLMQKLKRIRDGVPTPDPQPTTKSITPTIIDDDDDDDGIVRDYESEMEGSSNLLNGLAATMESSMAPAIRIQQPYYVIALALILFCSL